MRRPRPVRRAAFSPSSVSKDGPPNNSASGLGVKRCHICARADRETKETIRNGLTLLRVRYGIPYCELPDVDPSQLGRYLNFLLLQGKERASVEFPRRQKKAQRSSDGEKNDGLCSLQRLRRHERWELAHSVASIKRNLPAGCSLCTPSVRSTWEKNAFSRPPPTSPEYLDFVRRESARLFKGNWDRSYGSFVMSHVPNPSAREPKKSRADVLWQGRREEFITLTTTETDLAAVFGARYKEVMSAGKVRPLVIFDELVDLLAPLHKTVFSFLEKETDWLLCGPPTGERMASVCVNAYQTSVDLVNATDGLCHDVAEAILDVMFFPSLNIPRSIRALAKASLKPLIAVETGCRRRVEHGQMMGSYLSFPLLCLQSYFAARWAARFDPQARFLVNGDDAVISASREVLVEDYPPGFRLNDTKTIRSRVVVEVNSTAFLKRGSKWVEVRHLRRGGATLSYEGMMHMAAAVSSRPCWVDAFVRSRIGKAWGFLPSQLGHLTYPAFSRERGLLSKTTNLCARGRALRDTFGLSWVASRKHKCFRGRCTGHRIRTALPEPESTADDRIVRIQGRDASARESEALNAFLWEHGRAGGRKRDVFSPSLGEIRRTYAYGLRPYFSHLSYVYSDWKGSAYPVKKHEYFLPREEYTDEEILGLFRLDLFRDAFSFEQVVVETAACLDAVIFPAPFAWDD